MSLNLTDVEMRVLGVLIEKALTQPGSYPLTLNAITLGANQLQNRDPVLSLTEHEVSAAIRTLHLKNLVAQAPPSPGARANRFAHRVVETLTWDRRDQAVMAELMLRGRQTAGELRTRASRMTPFQDVDSVMVTLQGLMARVPPLVAELPREPGRSANRFRQDVSAGAVDARNTEAATAADVAAFPSAETDSQESNPSTIPTAWMKRLLELEAKVATLSGIVEDLKRSTKSASSAPPGNLSPDQPKDARH